MTNNVESNSKEVTSRKCDEQHWNETLMRKPQLDFYPLILREKLLFCIWYPSVFPLPEVRFPLISMSDRVWWACGDLNNTSLRVDLFSLWQCTVCVWFFYPHTGEWQMCLIHAHLFAHSVCLFNVSLCSLCSSSSRPWVSPTSMNKGGGRRPQIAIQIWLPWHG